MLRKIVSAAILAALVSTVQAAGSDATYSGGYPEEGTREIRFSTTRTTRIFVAGDVCPAYNIKPGREKRPFFSTEADSLIRSYDMAIMNYETATTHPGMRKREKKFVFFAEPSAPRALTMFGYASVANNHTFDLFEAGYEHTEKALTAAGIRFTGISSGRNKYEPLKTNIRGTDVFLYAGTIWGSSMGKYKTPTPADVEKDLRSRIFSPGSLKIVYLHGDLEYEKKTSAQAVWSAKLADAGADAVLWAHSHVYGPVEYSGNTIVAYGLGNFLFGGNSGWKNRKGILGLELRFERGKKTGFEWKRFSASDYVLSPER